MSQPPPPHEGLPPNMLPPQPNMAPPTSYYPEAPTDLTGGLPINLDSLRDGPPGSKPFYPYSTLIRYAIKGSPNQKLLLEDIYYAIESRFPYFRTAPSGWKNSVRHNLSLNPCFEKVPRPLTDRGKGSYWTVNDNVDPRTGVHRVRKKRGAKSQQNTQLQAEDADTDYHPPELPDASFEDPHGHFGQPPLHADGSGPSGRPTPFPPPFPPFDGPFSVMNNIRFPMEGEELELDEHGNVNWRVAWLKELANLQHLTAEHDKAQVEPEWYRMMLLRVRGALMAPINPAEGVVHVVPGQPSHGMPVPPTNGELQQE